MLSSTEIEVIFLSLRIAAVSTAISLPFGIAVAYVLARSRFTGKNILSAIVHLPLVLPPVVTGYALLAVFGRHGVLGQLLESTFGIVLAFQWTGAALAAGVMSFPLMVRSIRLAIEAVDPGLEEAAATLGAAPVYRFTWITFPLIFPGIIAGAVMAFARALGEFGATITFAGNIPGHTRTVSTAIHTLLQIPGGDDAALRLIAFSGLIAIVAVLISEFVATRVAARIRGR